MENLIVYWGCIGIMKNKMETTIVYWGYIGMREKMETTVVYWGYFGIMEKKIQTTISYCGLCDVVMHSGNSVVGALHLDAGASHPLPWPL